MCVSFLTLGAGIVAAQAAKPQQHTGATDPWGASYKGGQKVIFSGTVTGIEIASPGYGVDNEVTLLVKNRESSGTSIVDLGPSWYVNHQTAKIRIKDKVQVVGSKVSVSGHPLILASKIRAKGLVLTLRRASGRAYWMGTEVSATANAPSGPNVRAGTISSVGSYSWNGIPYGEAVLQTQDGLVNVDLGPQWYYGQQNVSYQVGDRVSVVVGTNPITVGPSQSVFPSYSIYQGSTIYTIRNPDGSPVYYWGGNR